MYAHECSSALIFTTEPCEGSIAREFSPTGAAVPAGYRLSFNAMTMQVPGRIPRGLFRAT